VLAVAQTHDRAVLQPGGDFQLGRQSGAVDHEGVIPGGLEGRGQAAEDACPGMVHGAHLAMDDLVAANAEEGDARRGGGPGQGQADPGGGGVAGAGGEDDHLRLHRDHVLDLQGIVPLDDDIRAKLAQVVDEVPGEAVVVVDQEEHRVTFGPVPAGYRRCGGRCKPRHHRICPRWTNHSTHYE